MVTWLTLSMCCNGYNLKKQQIYFYSKMCIKKLLSIIVYFVIFFFIPPDNALFSTEKYLYFSYFSTKTVPLKCLTEVLLMSTHNMSSWRNKKNIMWIPPLI